MGNENSSYYDSDRESDFVRVEDVRVDAKDDEDEAQQISLARELSLVERDKMVSFISYLTRGVDQSHSILFERLK
jgi:hypothetical protein